MAEPGDADTWSGWSITLLWCYGWGTGTTSVVKQSTIINVGSHFLMRENKRGIAAVPLVSKCVLFGNNFIGSV